MEGQKLIYGREGGVVALCSVCDSIVLSIILQSSV
ncbi:hypothetical protein A2U01_0097623, partial [Trifolium medium]|nr:hypothetical protein [Trifolium medium]